MITQEHRGTSAQAKRLLGPALECCDFLSSSQLRMAPSDGGALTVAQKAARIPDEL